MNYTLHQLLIFLTVCETKSITKASEELFLTQPAISIQLKKFQSQFDIPLTELIGRKIHITDFGQEIAKVSTRILKETENIKSTTLKYKGLLAGKISISVVSTGKYVMPYFMSDFIKKHSFIDISIDVTNKAKVIESLAKNETDFSLVSILPEDIEIERVELMKNRLFLVTGGELKKSTISKKDLAQLPLVLREKGSATRTATENFLKSINIIPESRLELVSNEAVKQAVCAGLGYSIVPLIGMTGELESGKVEIIPMKGLPIETSWNLIYNKNKNLSPAANAFLEHVISNKEAIMKQHFSKIDEDF